MKILLVRLRLIGDVVFTTPLLRGLKEHLPHAQLTYVVEPSAAPIVSGNPHLSHTLVAPASRGLARMRDDLVLAATLRRERFDIAIDLHGGPRAGWLTWASRAPLRIGYRIRGRSWMYTTVIERPADEAPRHSVLNQWDLLEPLGVPPCEPGRYPVEMPEDIAADSRPPASFVETIERLVRADPSRRVVVTSGPSEVELASRISHDARARLGSLAHALPELPEVDLPALRALIARASLYIGGDSGPLHIAATTTTPVVALFGPTLPERSLPWRSETIFAEGVDGGPRDCRPCRQRTCVHGDFRCLTAITPQMVVDAAERALSSRAGRLSMAAHETLR
jgi:ADP-heptose:LPS heptosyltransferase